MSVQQRDSFQDDSCGGELVRKTAPVCAALVLAQLLVFVLQIFLVRYPQIEDLHRPTDVPAARPQNSAVERLGLMRISVVEQWCQLDTDKVVFHGQLWRLVTCAFCHSRLAIWCIAVNVLMLYWFGRRLEEMVGSGEFLLFYLVAIVATSVVHVALDLLTQSRHLAIGASGAIMAILMLATLYSPRRRFSCLGFAVELRWLLLWYVVVDLLPVLLALAGVPLISGIAQPAALSGLAFAFLYHKYNWNLEACWPRRLRWSWTAGLASQQPAPLVSEREISEEEQEVLLDQVLQKLHVQGALSLSDSEQALLQKASERYRQRNKA